MEKKMNEKWLLHIIAVGAFVVFIVLGLACASNPPVDPLTSAVKFDSADTLKDYLNEQPDNSPDKPIAVIVTVNDQTLKDVVDIIKLSGKYVYLGLFSSDLKTITADIFTNCANLTGINLPNSVTSIMDNAFNGCASLIEINLGSNIASISNTAFNNCPSLLGIIVDSKNQNYTSGLYGQENGYSRPLYNKDRTILIRCPEGYKGDFNIADSVNVLAPYCFYQTSITNMTIYADIGPYAFSRSSITSVTLGGGGLILNTTGNVITQASDIAGYHSQTIYENAFINCTSLTSVTFGGDVRLEKGSFDGDLFEVWDKATTINLTNGSKGRDGSFKGRFTRPNGTSTTWTRTAGR